MATEQYLQQFKSEEEIQHEMDRLNKNLRNISIMNKYWLVMANKKIALYNYSQNFNKGVESGETYEA